MTQLQDNTEGKINLKQWLATNKLTKYADKFAEESLGVEELLVVRKFYASPKTFLDEYLVKELNITNKADCARLVVALNRTEALTATMTPGSDPNTGKRVEKVVRVVISEAEELLMGKLDAKQRTIDAIVPTLESYLDRLLENEKLCSVEIDNRTDKLIANINDKRRDLLQQCKEMSANKQQKLQSQLTAVRQNCDNIEKTQSEVETLTMNAQMKRSERKEKIEALITNVLRNEVSAIPTVTNTVKLIWNDKIVSEFLDNFASVLGLNRSNPPIVSLNKADSSSLTVKWKLDNNGNQTDIQSVANEFMIDYCKARLEECKDESKVDWQSSDVLLNQFEYTIPNLSLNTQYSIRIRGRNHALAKKYATQSAMIWSQYSTILNAKTANIPLLSPMFTDLESSQFNTILTNKIGLKKYSLLYRGSRDGFAMSTLHQKCDNKGTTLTIVRSKNYNHICGGYTSQSWKSSGGYVKDENAFLFLVRCSTAVSKKHNITLPIIFDINNARAGNAIYCHGSRIAFGSGHDLYIVNNCNSVTSNYSSFPYSYTESSAHDKKDLLMGAYNFSVDELEVFRVE